MAALGGALIAVVERPVVARLTRRVAAERRGLFGSLRPGPTRTVLELLALDYTLFVWHVLTHRVPPLWRFHAAHHLDRDLTASTGLRFHLGELLLAIPWRLLQIRIIGVGHSTLELWQALTVMSILFHHSNVKLPRRLEEALSWVIVTPGLHTIHHSTRPTERDSNWSSGLSLWDRLHGTLRTESCGEVVVGLVDQQAEGDDNLFKSLLSPFSNAAL
jgi:sterol desaturase/sphingolipid hydroxylase (fatty acid hydroxylase superfamily)